MSKANKHKTSVLVVAIKMGRSSGILAFTDLRCTPELH